MPLASFASCWVGLGFLGSGFRVFWSMSLVFALGKGAGSNHNWNYSDWSRGGGGVLILFANIVQRSCSHPG